MLMANIIMRWGGEGEAIALLTAINLDKMILYNLKTPCSIPSISQGSYCVSSTVKLTRFET